MLLQFFLPFNNFSLQLKKKCNNNLSKARIEIICFVAAKFVNNNFHLMNFFREKKTVCFNLTKKVTQAYLLKKMSKFIKYYLYILDHFFFGLKRKTALINNNNNKNMSDEETTFNICIYI